MRAKGWESNTKLIKGVGSQKRHFGKERGHQKHALNRKDGPSKWGMSELGWGPTHQHNKNYTYKHTYSWLLFLYYFFLLDGNPSPSTNGPQEFLRGDWCIRERQLRHTTLILLPPASLECGEELLGSMLAQTPNDDLSHPSRCNICNFHFRAKP